MYRKFTKGLHFILFDLIYKYKPKRENVMVTHSLLRSLKESESYCNKIKRNKKWVSKEKTTEW